MTLAGTLYTRSARRTDAPMPAGRVCVCVGGGSGGGQSCGHGLARRSPNHTGWHMYIHKARTQGPLGAGTRPCLHPAVWGGGVWPCAGAARVRVAVPLRE